MDLVISASYISKKQYHSLGSALCGDFISFASLLFHKRAEGLRFLVRLGFTEKRLISNLDLLLESTVQNQSSTTFCEIKVFCFLIRFFCFARQDVHALLLGQAPTALFAQQIAKGKSIFAYYVQQEAVLAPLLVLLLFCSVRKKIKAEQAKDIKDKATLNNRYPCFCFFCLLRPLCPCLCFLPCQRHQSPPQGIGKPRKRHLFTNRH